VGVKKINILLLDVGQSVATVEPPEALIIEKDFAEREEDLETSKSVAARTTSM